MKEQPREMSELERQVRIGAGWVVGLFLLLLAFVSLLHARLAAIIFIAMAFRVLPPARDWVQGLGRPAKIALGAVAGALIVWFLLLGY